jgi:glutamyl-tRNA reductase
MVVGETQILGQVKGAYQQACDCGSVGKLLHALFQRALAAAKDVHENTSLSAGRLSVASVAVDLARSVFDRFDDKTVVCLGAGKMAGLMLRHLRGLGPKRVVIANRSMERARAAAVEFGAEASEMEALEDLLVEADILLASTGAPHALVTEAGFRGLLKARKYRPIVIVDIAVPRDVEAGVGELANVYLYNVDDLQEAAAGNREKREEEVAAARRVVEKHAGEFLKWRGARDVGPLVKALYERCREIAKAELEEAISRRPEMSAAERAELERLTHRLIGKMLHEPVTKLTAESADPLAGAGLSAALKELFNLEKPSGG